MKTIIALLLSCVQCFGSLVFGAATSDRVNHGSASSIDALTTYTFLLWVYPTTLTVDRVFFMSGDTNFLGVHFSDSNDLEFAQRRATTDARAQTNSSVLSTNAWIFIAITYDSTDGPRAFTGVAPASAVEAGYVVRDVGSGANSNNAARDMMFGNRNVAAFNLAFQGRIAVIGIANTRWDVNKIRGWQFRPRKTDDMVLYSQYGFNGTNAQTDLSGTGNAGTVTGATVGAHVPLGAPFALLRDWFRMRVENIFDILFPGDPYNDWRHIPA